MNTGANPSLIADSANIDSNKNRTAKTVSVWAKTHFRKFLPQILANEKIDCLNTVHAPLAVFLEVLVPQGIWQHDMMVYNPVVITKGFQGFVLKNT